MIFSKLGLWRAGLAGFEDSVCAPRDSSQLCGHLSGAVQKFATSDTFLDVLLGPRAIQATMIRNVDVARGSRD